MELSMSETLELTIDMLDDSELADIEVIAKVLLAWPAAGAATLPVGIMLLALKLEMFELMDETLLMVMLLIVFATFVAGR